MTQTSELITRTLGRTGITVPALGMGCWPIGGPDTNMGMPMGWSTAVDAESIAGLRTAYELGVRLFDTADVYGHGHSERLVGRMVAEVPRSNLVLTSKVGYFTGTAEHGYQPGHMRRQLEQSLDNLGTDHLDIYFLHHADFGPEDRWLAGAVHAMHEFRAEGLIRAIGMRGPHRYAPDRRRSGDDGLSRDKVARFAEVFDQVQPDVLAVRDNLLTPGDRTAGILSLAATQHCGVLFNKPLGQGLLTVRTLLDEPPTFGAGDHRARKRWFTPAARAVIAAGLRELQTVVGDDPTALISVASWSCLTRFDHAAVLTGFTTSAQVRENVAALRTCPPARHLMVARHIMSGVQRQLDTAGHVFLDAAKETV